MNKKEIIELRYGGKVKSMTSKKNNWIKRGSISKFIITLVLTIVAVVLIGFAVSYFQGGI